MIVFCSGNFAATTPSPQPYYLLALFLHCCIVALLHVSIVEGSCVAKQTVKNASVCHRFDCCLSLWHHHVCPFCQKLLAEFKISAVAAMCSFFISHSCKLLSIYRSSSDCEFQVNPKCRTSFGACIELVCLQVHVYLLHVLVVIEYISVSINDLC